MYLLSPFHTLFLVYVLQKLCPLQQSFHIELEVRAFAPDFVAANDQ